MRRPLILMIGSGDSIPNCKPEDITIYGPFNSVKEAMKIVRDMFDGAPFSIKTARANKLFIIESLNKTGKPLTGI